jgi:hypothetical protein
VGVCALFLCAHSAFGQTRPVLSEVWKSHVVIQITTGTGADAMTVEGVGEMTFNQPAGQAREFYAFKDGSPTERISRYDLGKIFTSKPPNCDVEDVTGTMEPFFAWVANAKMGSSDEVNGIVGTTWVSTGTAPNPTLTLLATNGGTGEPPPIPLYYQEATADRTVKIIFLDWQATFNLTPNLFTPPNKCVQ